MELLSTLVVSIIIFNLYILVLVTMLLIAKAKIGAGGEVKLLINDDDSLTKTVNAGETLLTTLSSQGILIPSACGGGGTCGMCKVQVLDGAGDILPTETGHISRMEAKDKWREWSPLIWRGPGEPPVAAQDAQSQNESGLKHFFHHESKDEKSSAAAGEPHKDPKQEAAHHEKRHGFFSRMFHHDEEGGEENGAPETAPTSDDD